MSTQTIDPPAKVELEPGEAVNILCAMIDQAVLDASGRGYVVKSARMTGRKKIMDEAREWLVEELPYWMAMIIDMDVYGIEAMQKELKLWVRCGCPRNGSFGPGSDNGPKQLWLMI